jgi:hypothetical protein
MLCSVDPSKLKMEDTVLLRYFFFFFNNINKKLCVSKKDMSLLKAGL